MQPIHFARQFVQAFALQSVREHDHDGALPKHRRDQSLLNRCRDEPIRVPPAQSSTPAPQAANASSGSFARSNRVTLVSRVPNKKE